MPSIDPEDPMRDYLLAKHREEKLSGKLEAGKKRQRRRKDDETTEERLQRRERKRARREARAERRDRRQDQDSNRNTESPSTPAPHSPSEGLFIIPPPSPLQ